MKFKFLSLRTKRSNPVLFWIAASGFALLAMTVEARADIEPVTYSPEYCEFSATFPEEPHLQRRCEDDSQEKCYDLISYTQVFEMSSTVSVRVICNPSGEEIFKNYSGEVMEATVKAMTEKSVVKTFDTSFREEEGFKQAGLVGEGKTGVTPTIYIAQLWIGKKSIMSVEAEMTGEKHDDADKLFSSILQSIHYSANDPKPAEELKEEPKEEKSE